MLNYFESLNPVMQAFLATLMTYSFTIAGSALVFFFKKVNRNVMDALLGVAGGVMIAASFFSLIAPAIDRAESLGQIPWLIVSVGFFLGGVLLFITDKVSSRVLKNSTDKKNFMLMLSITMHNIPEGMVVGLTFGSLIYGGITASSALMLALGIGIQNFQIGRAHV